MHNSKEREALMAAARNWTGKEKVLASLIYIVEGTNGYDWFCLIRV